MSPLWLILPLITSFSNPDEPSTTVVSQRGMVARSNVQFEIPVTKDVRKFLGSELSRLGRKGVIGIEEIYETRLRMQQIVDRSGMGDARVSVEFRFVVDAFNITFKVKSLSRTT
jgi:hypothetical protein